MSKQLATTIPDEIVMSKIYMIQDQKVMLDEDLAALYGVETRRLNEQVKRNIDRFPEDFMFTLTEEEFANLKSQMRHRGGVDEENFLMLLQSMVC